ncbi:MAG: hypothetical protein ACREIP_15300 [Alphaproteobacteria bacterium]
MQRLFSILILGFLALGIAGFSAGPAEAAAAQCAPTAASVLDELEAMTVPAAQTEGPATRRASPAEGRQLACNSSCARSCSQRFGSCHTRECRQQYNACIRGCGC